MVLRQAFVLVLGGVLIGLPLAIVVGTTLKSLLFGLGAIDPATLVLATLVMFGAAALAAYLPARRACRMDPMKALRAE
jgi:ABC-type antimicrobial peptide transport system permease subunit